ncbi:LysM peptidoglycan-binding domain-containing protein [Metaclostridioides mangenotii]|uniref:LysM peptidoglycan-binding domain-containing protein n=1 Tax=Metaclostridioides mangenotii TaxID=1540 RepID=UPI0026EE2C1E|nr:LysM peptidoglycan-binding domain-containing protein [Clostridioides mangenotii]
MDIINTDIKINVYLFDIVETKTFQFPVNPIDSLKLKYESRIETVDILDIGEVDIFKDGESIQEINFNTILPFDYSAPYYKAGVVVEPETALSELKKWAKDKKILRLMISDMNLNEQVIISKLEHERRAGEERDIYIDITFRTNRELKVKEIKKETQSNNAGLTNNRPSTNNNSGTTMYTTTSKDTLWAIAKKFLGNGSRWPEIYNIPENKKIIGKDPNKIRAGYKLVIPKK